MVVAKMHLVYFWDLICLGGGRSVRVSGGWGINVGTGGAPVCVYVWTMGVMSGKRGIKPRCKRNKCRGRGTLKLQSIVIGLAQVVVFPPIICSFCFAFLYVA